jgi:hypothetical protein
MSGRDSAVPSGGSEAAGGAGGPSPRKRARAAGAAGAGRAGEGGSEPGAPTASSAGDPFEVRGKLSVRSSATVLCVRRMRDRAEHKEVEKEQGFAERFKEQYGEARVQADAFLRNYLSEPSFEFTCKWEVLLGQGEGKCA